MTSSETSPCGLSFKHSHNSANEQLRLSTDIKSGFPDRVALKGASMADRHRSHQTGNNNHAGKRTKAVKPKAHGHARWTQTCEAAPHYSDASHQ